MAFRRIFSLPFPLGSSTGGFQILVGGLHQTDYEITQAVFEAPCLRLGPALEDTIARVIPDDERELTRVFVVLVMVGGGSRRVDAAAEGSLGSRHNFLQRFAD